MSQPRNKISSIGALYQKKTWHGTSIHELDVFCKEATYLCGHNILLHDLVYLKNAGIADSFLQKNSIDTLQLSPLFFPNKPYHRLIKDYRLDRAEFNNPVYDSGLAKEVLEDCLQAWLQMDGSMQYILQGLLQHDGKFSGFFKLLFGNVPRAPDFLQLSEEISVYFNEGVCTHADLYSLILEKPVQLAYVLSLLKAPDTSSIIPPWLLHQYPDLPLLLNQLRGTSCHKDDCAYCAKHNTPQAGLKRYFGYPGFRKFSESEEIPLQQQVVEASLKGESLLAIFPTGGGKSLTFQLPALMRGEATRGLTVIISPLQALMKDQVDVLSHRFDITNAVFINGLLSPLERAETIAKVREGGAQLLYIAPESLRSKTILTLLKGRLIDRFVIDEAHCFSAWGQDFRVDYLYIGRFLTELAAAKKLPSPIPVSCFTATAKPEVIQDIQNYFEQKAGIHLNIYQTSATRKNLSYFATPSSSPDIKLQKLQNLLQTVEEPSIVYVSRTKTAVKVAEALKNSGFRAAAYHGQMEVDEKIRTQDAFMHGHMNIIVATSAFGMGVDKENVKMVVHYDISDSLENYLQEAGRAGRKPDLEAHCHLLFDEEDLNAHFNLLNQTKITQKEVGQIWKAVKDFKRKQFSKSALEIAKSAGWETDNQYLETQVKAAIAALEDVGYLRREMNSPRIFANSILVKNVEAANKVIRDNLYRFPGKEEEYAVRIFQYLISRDATHADQLSDDLGIDHYIVVRILLHFKDLGLLGDTKDLTALINPTRSNKNTERCFKQSTQVEYALLNALLPTEDSPAVIQIHLREINEHLLQHGCDVSSIEIIKNLLNFWQHQHYIQKERLEAQTLFYRITFKVNREKIRQDLRHRKDLANGVVRWLLDQNNALIASKQKREEAALAFSMVEMQQSLRNGLFQLNAELIEYERVLLYLHFICAIKLEGGLFVLYNPMTIVKVEENPKKQYTKEDYAKLERHYEKKTEQIHIMGEYARKQLHQHVEALKFVDDYFQMPYEQFIQKHFQGQRGKLRRPITDKKFKEIFGALSEEQLAVVKDKTSPNILIGAGPGSGKTRVLVHKVAALLMMEDIKADQFLMLTFSRPAAMEFKERLHGLIGTAGHYVDIFTYHGLAFQLLGRIGDLEKSDSIIQQATLALQQDEIASDRIKSKSVIVVDEYQDISQQEYDFLKTLIEVAGEVRVIVVGDDDQNIYEFRGSSVAFMRSFQRDREAKSYFLSKNYRAHANLVEFSNQFLSLFASERLKAGMPLLPQQTQLGQLVIINHHPESDLVLPLVQDLLNQDLSGTTAVLTHTNEEALLVQSLLRQHQIPAKLVLAQDGYSLCQLLELKIFSHYIYHDISKEIGFITDDSWLANKKKVAQEFATSANMALALEVINVFERASGKRRYWSDWTAYLHEAKAEDYLFPDSNKVLVSTMHKAKGKEFDHVYLLLKNFKLTTEARKRVVYVAITRAKKTLHVHTDQTYFNQFPVQNLKIATDSTIYPALNVIQLELGMSDVFLSYFRNLDTQKAVKKVRSGNALIGNEQIEEGLSLDGQFVVKFSNKFKERLRLVKHQGYIFNSAEVAHIVVWYCQEENKEFRIILPRLVFTRS
ncbi:hypothetical protein TH61_14395 [Rufibacter sp. DG15C]|nr:hypothetical protein TH61_14395 [Rufibacter sp. DG15C]